MEDEQPKKSVSAFEAIGIVWDLLIIIAVPTVLFGVLGQWLDKRYGTRPLFLILGLLVSLGVVSIATLKRGRQIAKRL